MDEEKKAEPSRPKDHKGHFGSLWKKKKRKRKKPKGGRGSYTVFTNKRIPRFTKTHSDCLLFCNGI